MNNVRNRPHPFILSAISVSLAALLAGCGGGSGDSTSTSTAKYKVGGTVSGLASGNHVVLGLNGLENLTVSADGSFTFSTTVYSGATYHVTVAANPDGELCTINDPSYSTIYADVSNVAVQCGAVSSTVSTVAGHAGVSGTTDGAGTAAYFNNPVAVAADAAGNLYVSDSSNNTVRKIDAAGNVTTIAGTAGVIGSTNGIGAAASFYHPSGIAVDGTGNVFVADGSNHTIRKIDTAGNVTTIAGAPGQVGYADGTGTAASFDNPAGIALDGAGNIYVADRANSTIRKVTQAGVVTTFAGSPGLFAHVDGTGTSANFYAPVSLAVDAAGNVYVTDGDNTIRKITPAGVVTTLVGTSGNYGAADGTSASFNQLGGIAIGPDGNLYVVDEGNYTIRKVTPAGAVTTIAGTVGTSGSADGNGGAAMFNTPSSLAVDGAGGIYVTDYGNHTIRKVTQ